ncbi:glycosyltransferase family 2 protein [filamentous cyanobacterium LEGE 11480]|uniref:Glycosyltransferase family 2 protein n=1 Tax=Romeriopsis navalis LEGE 11480 TaxID=2777977 RepID=A0A928VQI5_9CYAN|nr:glycosyltransferase family 2 protein [Romeriopsis navalis LEGE 11480]
MVAPAYNESSILQNNLGLLCEYLVTLENQYDWELVVVNDGSRDDTGYLAERFAEGHDRIRVVHHRVNQGLGQALRTAFEAAHGDYIVVVDLDLSYSPDHIGRLLDRMEETNAAMVVASPYMPGGSIANVPWLRKALSIWANRFLSFAAKRSLATLTGMVRVYDAEFIHMLNLRSRGMDINPEIIHKALMLMSQIEEIPGHLHWREPIASTPAVARSKKAKKRSSSMKILHHTYDVLFSGFLFRPVVFFLIPSLFMFALSAYSNFWVLWHCVTQYQALPDASDPTIAVANAFAAAPHTFFIGGMTLMLGIQLFSLGILSAQNKSYFEELFYLGSANSRRQRR